MSVEAVKWALRIDRLSQNAKMVLVVLAEHANATGGDCFPSIGTLVRQGTTGSRRRAIEGIRELEAVGAIQVRRSGLVAGKGRGVNRYQLAVGQAIEIPIKSRRKTGRAGSPVGTRVVLPQNQGGSPVGTITTNEPPLNHHSDIQGISARLAVARRAHAESNPTEGTVASRASKQDCSGRRGPKPASPWPDDALIAMAERSGLDVNEVLDAVEDKRPELIERALAGDGKARRDFRTLFFAIIGDRIPDFAPGLS